MYYDFQQRLASQGFISTPITETQYWALIAAGHDDDTAADVASDVACGFSFEEACDAN